MQDPENREIVYAGTTEGLYKTENGGKTFSRMTGADVIVNDVYVDPGNRNRVLLATDRGGVLVSQDAGVTFTASNQGISERKVAALLVDRTNPDDLYAGVVNDKNFGGVFRSTDGGAHWEQLGSGLEGADVFALAQTKDGAVVAGTSNGIFVLNSSSSDDDPPKSANEERVSRPEGGADPAGGSTLSWQPRSTIANTVMKAMTETRLHTRVDVEKQVQAPVISLQSSVNSLDVSTDVWVAADELRATYQP